MHMRFTFLLLLFIGSTCYGQVTSFYQAQFNGGVTACGYGPDYSGGGTGTFTLSIAPGSSIYKAWLFAGRQGVAADLTVTLNNSSLTFNSGNQASSTFNSTNYGGASGVHAIDVSSIIDPSVNTYTLVVPSQTGPQDRYEDFYLYVAYSNNTMQQVTSCIFLNSADMQPDVYDQLNVNYAIDSAQNIGMAMYLGYACSTGDGENLTVNGTFLGTMGGNNSNSGGCAGPYGDFAYQNGTLTALLDCNADQATNAQDALSNIQGLVNNCATSIQADFSHSSSDNAIWGIFLTYGSGSKGENSDTSVCAGSPVQLNVPSGTVSWSPTTNLSCSNCSNPVATPSITTAYVASITGSGCNAAVNDTAFITILTGGTITLQASPSTICAGDTVRLSAIADSAVSWSPANSLSCSVCDTTFATPAGTLKYYATLGFGNCMANDSITVTVNPVPTAIIGNGIGEICPGDSANICAPAGFVSYMWNNFDTTLCIEAKNAGNYYVNVTDSNNCSAQSNHFDLMVFETLPVSISTNGDTLIVYNASGVQWFFNNHPINGATSDYYVARNSGSYTVQVTDTNGCKSSSSPVIYTGIGNINEDGKILIYPNPISTGNAPAAQAAWQLSVGSNLIGSQMEILDDNGRLVYKEVIKNLHTEISLQLASGVYFLRITTGSNVFARKLVKL